MSERVISTESTFVRCDNCKCLFRVSIPTARRCPECGWTGQTDTTRQIANKKRNILWHLALWCPVLYLPPMIHGLRFTRWAMSLDQSHHFLFRTIIVCVPITIPISAWFVGKKLSRWYEQNNRLDPVTRRLGYPWTSGMLIFLSQLWVGFFAWMVMAWNVIKALI